MSPDDLRYTKEHEWVRIEDNEATIGITDHAQDELGDVVFVELPKVGDSIEANESFGNVESVKSVSELFMPLTGEVLEVNADLDESPELVNGSPYDKGWMLRIQIKKASEIDDLLSSADYEEFVSKG
jgi:glycine cleavage system H protein